MESNHSEDRGPGVIDSSNSSIKELNHDRKGKGRVGGNNKKVVEYHFKT